MAADDSAVAESNIAKVLDHLNSQTINTADTKTKFTAKSVDLNVEEGYSHGLASINGSSPGDPKASDTSMLGLRQQSTAPQGTHITATSKDLPQNVGDVTGDVSKESEANTAPETKTDLSPNVAETDSDRRKARPSLPIIIDRTKDSGTITDKGNETVAVVYEILLHSDSLETKGGYRNFELTPLVHYRDKQPLKLKPHMVSTDSDTAIGNGENQTVEWNEPVFHVCVSAQARMPDVTSLIQWDDAKAGIKCPCSNCREERMEEANKLIKTSRIDSSLFPKTVNVKDITHFSKQKIIVKSPFLLEALNRLIKHHPGFKHDKYSSDESTKLGVEFNYPYNMFMHHFTEMKDFAPVKGENIVNGKEKQDTSQTASEKSNVLQTQHMAELVAYLEPLYKDLVLPCEQRLGSADTPQIDFDMLWYLLQPGTQVYVRDEWTPCFSAVVDKIHSTGTLDCCSKDTDEWSVDLWYLSCDGAKIGRVSLSDQRVARWKGMKDVVSLDICPVSVWDKHDGGTRRKDLLRRGKFLEKVFRNGHILARYDFQSAEKEFVYSEKVVVDHMRGQCMTGLELRDVGYDSPVRDRFIDHDDIFINEGYTLDPRNLPANDIVTEEESQKDSGHTCRERPKVTARKVLPLAAKVASRDSTLGRGISRSGGSAKNTDLTEAQCMLIYPLTFGLSLKTKQWIEIDASGLVETEPSDESFNNLVLAEADRQLIKALSSRLSKTAEWTADFIPGKGSGGIVLLHGPPGVGKTFTVESIAQSLHLPLLALTVADIGTTETKVEKALSRWFALAEQWRCVLLIDEADIFLERRHNRDIGRNGLVSAFLRQAEYFKGLLFLTTNRVGQIDDAFMSRVHVPIAYHVLEAGALVKIWTGFFQKLKRDRSSGINVEQGAKTWITEKFMAGAYSSLNGRDIRNALQTVITLAEYEFKEKINKKDPDVSPGDPVALTQQHFERVLDMTHQFRKYIHSITHEDEKKRAHNRKDRNDFEWKEEKK